ncbi:TRAFs-binding domain-containing protein [Oceanobacillus polygoni]|uniref:Tetratricopeptide (TPR) repeat protein n=1 Tax=Oceanobacillus polygoni TaxID=1235259 RepID=A0A9X0YVW1_9BACI|nr:TRAFs-binding domain-containing protein [Oceanobacillus polygoni]MBP2079772.1 tetratricopeptide (TPR) repeat protein [Oceanobacillus polygoni]
MKRNNKCFVIMGYGIKTDLSTGRELNLDKTYKNIIKPAAEEAGLECIRADEVKHSGTIDVPMYNLLINADVVIADLSTNNSNAFYELGVRHALRPKTTIAIAENDLKPPFDVDHTVIRKYEHLGKDIGYDEALRFKNELIDTIKVILDTQEIDSPVYTYLKGLKPPTIEETGENTEEPGSDGLKDTLGNIIESAIRHLDKDEFIEAKSLLKHANTIDPNNEYILQKLALATYKSKYPSHIEALKEALEIVESLNPEKTTDPETLGLSGAINKRLWEELNEKTYLQKSISNYEKGFYIKNDYYNGINLAYLYNVQASIEEEFNQAITDYIIANRIREKVISICKELYEQGNFNERSDKYWIVATLEEAYFAVGNLEKYEHFKKAATSIATDNWERKTTESQIVKLNELLEKSPIKKM